jgi:serine/threonine protein phosphatase PrpC
VSSPRAKSTRSFASSTPRPRAPRIEAFGLSHPGQVRLTNEDSYAVAPDVGFFAVADGVGGNAAGEVASRMAINVVRTMIEETAATWPTGLGRSLLELAVKEANAAVNATAVFDPEKAGMATTLTCLLALSDRVLVAHVGDSRAYLLRRRKLRQLTEDHTLVGAAVKAGTMTREEAAVSRERNVIVRAVGSRGAVEVDLCDVVVESGDTFLLASDGLHHVVEDRDIAAVLRRKQDIARATSKLVDLANEAGGPDNVTVVLVRVG